MLMRREVHHVAVWRFDRQSRDSTLMVSSYSRWQWLAWLKGQWNYLIYYLNHKFPGLTTERDEFGNTLDRKWFSWLWWD